MKKNFLFVALAAATGFLALTAFGGKTKADQMKEIASMVESKLADLTAEKAAECDARVADAAKTKFEAMAAVPAPAPPTIAPTKGKTTPKKGVTKSTPKPAGPSTATPLPQPTPAASNPKEGKLNGTNAAPVEPNTEAKASKISAEPPKPNTEAKAGKLKGGGGN